MTGGEKEWNLHFLPAPEDPNSLWGNIRIIEKAERGGPNMPPVADAIQHRSI